MITDKEILMVGETAVEIILEKMREHPSYREPDKYGYLCDCMHHYCLCNHEGFRDAYDLIASHLSDLRGKV